MAKSEDRMACWLEGARLGNEILNIQREIKEKPDDGVDDIVRRLEKLRGDFQESKCTEDGLKTKSLDGIKAALANIKEKKPTEASEAIGRIVENE